jgi:hypothetical protein
MRIKLGLGALLALLLAVGSISLASAGSSDKKPSDTGRVQVLKVMDRQVSTDFDLDKNGQYSQGDLHTFAGDLFRHGKKIGTDGGSCTVLRFERPSVTAQCVATLSLPKGQVTVQGLVAFTDPGKVRFVHAVTGGTGAYRTAHGELVGQTIDANQAHLTLKLID